MEGTEIGVLGKLGGTGKWGGLRGQRSVGVQECL